MKKLVVIALVAALACVSVAQGGGGQGRRGGMMMMGRGGMGGGARLALRPDVSKELKLTAEQKLKLEDMMESMRGQGMRMGGPGAGGPGGPNGGPPDMTEIRKMMAERREKERAEIAKILDEGQVKRLRELGIQRSGNSALTDPEVQKELKFTDAQMKKVEELQQKQMEAMRAVGEKIQNQEIDREEARGIFEKNSKIMDEELAKILTADQKAQFAKMGGAPFKFDPDEDRGPGGR